ncbi:MAG: YesL family protein [Oscillospiraceae bacterium]|nr:YesL family protein [Oscillospiraceae bacterium]
MRKLFDMDNPLMRILAVAADLLMLNVLTLVCCLPLLTAGAALTAAFDVAIHMVRGEQTYVVRPFFRAFAANWKQATLLWLVILGIGALIFLDYVAALNYLPALKLPVASLAVLLLALSLYAFALLSRYENTVPATLLNAAKLAAGFFPRTLGMVVFTLGLWLLSIQYYQYGILILLLFGFSLPCYVSALLLKGVFVKLEQDAA